MERSKDEIINILAEAVKVSFFDCSERCIHCDTPERLTIVDGLQIYKVIHDKDCPVLVAEEIIKQGE